MITKERIRQILVETGENATGHEIDEICKLALDNYPDSLEEQVKTNQEAFGQNPRVILNLPNNLKPEDVAKVMPSNAETPKEYKFLGHEVIFFKNEIYTGWVIKWAAEGIGFGEVTFSTCLQDHPREDGTFWAKKGESRLDTECMSEAFVNALIKHAVDDFVKALYKLSNE
jgi:hypothetical protein